MAIKPELLDQYCGSKPIDRRIIATNSDLKVASLSINFPDYLSNRLIVDVGGGASSVSSQLRDLGARAFAVDPKYTHLSQIRQLSRLNPSREYIIGSRELSDRFNHLGIMMLTPQALHDSCYVAGEAEKLAVRSNVADFVFSLNCISKHFTEDLESMWQMMMECVRIAKPGHPIQFAPWGVKNLDQPLTAAGFVNIQQTMLRLRASHLPFAVEDTQRGYKRLTVVKPGTFQASLF